MRSYLDSYSMSMLRTFVTGVVERDVAEQGGGAETKSRRKEEGEGDEETKRGEAGAEDATGDEDGETCVRGSGGEVASGKMEGGAREGEMKGEWEERLREMREWEKAVTFLVGVRGTAVDAETDEEYLKMVGRFVGREGKTRLPMKEVAQFKDEYLLMTRGRRVEAAFGKISLGMYAERESRVKVEYARNALEEDKNGNAAWKYFEEIKQRREFKAMLVESLEVGIAEMEDYIKAIKESTN